jgi:hypothetical protein
MTSAILSEIEKARQREKIAAWTKAENAMGEKFVATLKVEFASSKKVSIAIAESVTPPSQVESMLWQNFVEWCGDEGVRFCPARPSTVAAYLYSRKLQPDGMLDALRVISRQHDRHGLSNPCATTIVRATLELAVEDKPPASWRKAEQETWEFLPVEIRQAVARRESQRDKEIRRAQNENAELRKKLNVEKQDETIKPIASIGDESRASAS